MNKETKNMILEKRICINYLLVDSMYRIQFDMRYQLYEFFVQNSKAQINLSLFESQFVDINCNHTLLTTRLLLLLTFTEFSVINKCNWIFGNVHSRSLFSFARPIDWINGYGVCMQKQVLNWIDIVTLNVRMKFVCSFSRLHVYSTQWTKV